MVGTPKLMGGKKKLTVQTEGLDNDNDIASTDTETPQKLNKPNVNVVTPGTVSSTPGSKSDGGFPQTPVGLRGSHDLRSPGIAKTPADRDAATNTNATTNTKPIAQAKADVQVQPPLPDFITQTDRYGNAISPAPSPHAATHKNHINGSASPYQPHSQIHSHSHSQIHTPTKNQISNNNNHQMIQETGTDETDTEKDSLHQVDACDTLLESLRMMCCCILPDNPNHNSGNSNNTNGTTNTNSTNVNMNMNGNQHPHHSRNVNVIPGHDPKIVDAATAAAANTNQTNYNNYNNGKSPTGIYPPKQIMKEDVTGSIPHNIQLLPSIPEGDKCYGKKCLVLDLDETLVHSSFRAVPGADFVIPVQIEDVVHFVYVMKRPGVDEFLIEMAKHYEIVIYTASLNKYADPLLDLLDPHQTIRYRLFRESCVYYEGSYVKDLSLLNRDIAQTIIIDNSPASYIFHPENAIDCSSFIDDPRDRELKQIGSFLEGVRNVKDVRDVSNLWRNWPRISRVEHVIYPDSCDDEERQAVEKAMASNCFLKV